MTAQADRDFAAAYDAFADQWGAAELNPFIIDLARKRAPPPKAWLDLGCGPGHLLAEAADAGYEVTGLDTCGAMLDRARRRAPAATLIEGDARSARLDRSFSVITALAGLVNHGVRTSDAVGLLRSARRALSPNGVLIFDVHLPEGLAAHDGQAVVYEDEARFCVLRLGYEADRGRGVWRMTGFTPAGARTHRRFDRTVELRAYDRPTISRLAQRAGLTIRRSIDVHTLGRPRKASRMLLLVAGRT